MASCVRNVDTLGVWKIRVSSGCGVGEHCEQGLPGCFSCIDLRLGGKCQSTDVKYSVSPTPVARHTVWQ